MKNCCTYVVPKEKVHSLSGLNLLLFNVAQAGVEPATSGL